MEVKEGRIGNAFACERCRKHKVRCVPSEFPSLCQRCQKARVECIEHVARRRPAKPKGGLQQSPSRIAEMEKNLETISASIATSGPNPGSIIHPTLPPGSIIPSQISEVVRRLSTPAPIALAPALPIVPAIKTPILPNPISTPESASSYWEFMNDSLAGLGPLSSATRNINIPHMRSLLDTYRAMVDFFPFIPVPHGAFFQDLLLQRPVLMFAIFTVASYDSASLRSTLSREFRNIVLVRTMRGEKSLDLVQALLVFVAWHHHFMDAQAITIRTLLQLCIGVAIDIGLDNVSSSPYAPESAREREGKRAYLGCYYLSSGLGMLEVGRTRILPYSNTLRAYAADLASGWEHKSDTVLSSLVDTCRYVEDVEETFRNQSEQVLVVKSQVKRLSDRWDNMRTPSHQFNNDYKTLYWAQLAAKVHLYNLTIPLDISDRETIPSAPGFQLKLRLSCLRSVEQFLDNSTQLKATEYEYLSVVDWLSLISSLGVLGKLALHVPLMPGWDTSELQLFRMFDNVREQLCAKMPHRYDSNDQEDDTFERFRRITAIMKGAIKNGHNRGSPNTSSFEITSSSRQPVSILQELPPLNSNGATNNIDPLPAPWKVSPKFDMNSAEFPWKFLMGTL
ncbi:hypothetical protein B0J11DRAFT_55299 [Dendryphion nanum]|uniref:Zn(2)-C6 fungal-type domain-containing protein n=1 Tax=Dendryphion nanum TaxID=256645 RepID=A0A9P9DK95_9PLEO|nr:hypothetical protein B0J11DRAFT_55299 [Dendryphion nanum]